MRSISFALTLGLATSSTFWPPSDELEDESACTDIGIDGSLSEYRFSLAMPNTYENDYSDTIFHPLFASSSLSGDATDDSVTSAVVFIHGLAGDANTYFCDGLDISPEGVLVISPWFGDAQVTADDWGGWGGSTNSTLSSADVLSTYWTSSNWVKGGDASPGDVTPSRYTTSFDVIDVLIQQLSDLKSSGNFKNLERVTVNGFSAGAQLASRWSIFSKYASNNEDLDLDFEVRTIVADGSSYVYLDETRPNDSCTTLEDTGKTHTCSSFSTPDVDSCSSYNEWKYGLDFSDLSANVYLEPFAADPNLLTSQISTYVNNPKIYFLFGDSDVCNCNYEGYSNPQVSATCYPSGTSCSPNDFGGSLNGVQCCDTYPDTGSSNALAVGCEEMLQGSNRLQRGINYMAHIKELGGEFYVGFF
ncbi:hypothetical protein TL16_g01093 [Triparma laevis f. inornata]|uniref:Uncharacterized protein n=1 Tax=Triparma laevis f. inornata TaxID=1714386 RepID=A0A9W6ZJS9_9STRA|nr:hypothetical protein TL16_g01093 [Triparma laevis f. inornata]